MNIQDYQPIVSSVTATGQKPDGTPALINVGTGGTLLVAGTTPRITGSVARPADNTAYAAGDIIANSGTAASVVPITFNMGGTTGRLTGCRATVVAASGTIVLPAFDLILFRPNTDIPFAAGSYPKDNDPLPISAAAYNEVIAVYQFSASSWRNTAGGATAAGGHVYQAVSLSTRSIAPFNLTGLPSTTTLLGLVQAQNAWTPTGVVNTISFALDADLDS